MPAGEMQGTVHRLLLEKRQSELRPGSVLLLKQVRDAEAAAVCLGLFLPQAPLAFGPHVQLPDSHPTGMGQGALGLTPNSVLAGWCLLPIPSQPLPQCHPQQPAQDLPAGAREQLPAAIASAAGGEEDMVLLAWEDRDAGTPEGHCWGLGV